MLTPMNFNDRLALMAAEHGPDNCWPWPGAKLAGYGICTVTDPGVRGSKRNARAHRVAYERLVGPIPPGHHLHHTCGNHPCCNPKHLQPLTPTEHAYVEFSQAAKQRAKTHCPRGHEYTPENTWLRTVRSKERQCRTCNHERYIRQRDAKRASQQSA